jgi:hypothetical protein
VGRGAGGALAERAATHRLVSVLAVGLAVWLCSVASAGAYVYWANSTAGEGTTIGRANLDGSGVDPDFITGLDDPCGVAVDSQHIYWGNRGTNSIGRANLDGTGVDPGFIAVTGANADSPCGPAVNATDVWWANTEGVSGGSIGRANLDGTGVASAYISGGTVSNPTGVGLNSQFAYWTNADIGGGGNPSIYRQDLAGLPPQPVVPSAGVFPLWPTVNEFRLYWSVYIFGVSSTNLDGTDREELALASASGGVAILGDRLFWANGVEGTISRSNLDGSSPDFAFIRGIGHPFGLAVDAGVPPANDFSFGELKRNKRKGTAKLLVEVPGAGSLELAGKGLKTAVQDAGAAGEVELAIKAKGAKRRKLNDRGKLKLEAEVTFTPTGGAANTEATKVKLVKK